MHQESSIVGRDISLGSQCPAMSVTLLHPQDQGCFSSFGAQPAFGADLAGCDMHQRLLTAYGKLLCNPAQA